MSDQEQPPEGNADGLEDEPRYRNNPARTILAVRTAGRARGLSSEDNPLYAHLLNLAVRLDDPFLADQHVSALSNEFRQIVKHLGLDKVQNSEKREVGILESLGTGLKRPTRTA